MVKSCGGSGLDAAIINANEMRDAIVQVSAFVQLWWDADADGFPGM